MAWLSIRGREPAARGRANEVVRRLLADALEVALDRVALRAGATDRRKRFVLDAVDTDRLKVLRLSWLSPPAGG